MLAGQALILANCSRHKFLTSAWLPQDKQRHSWNLAFADSSIACTVPQAVTSIVLFPLMISWATCNLW
ncbi:hypothetical protein K438DRAFT_1852816 [Mycena galopus ATCC 62051]|nr:hypothetical protein K438DRAFT_1852816 [Mycena galopus ATCC 62051]